MIYDTVHFLLKYANDFNNMHLPGNFFAYLQVFFDDMFTWRKQDIMQ